MTDALSLAVDPLLPWPLVAGLGVALVLALALGFRLRAAGTLWRALALGALWLALVNPSLVEEEREYLPDIAVVIIDESRSQALGGRTAATRAALAELEERVAKLPDTELRIIRAGREPSLDADHGTRLFEALREGLAEIPESRLAGVFMVTDGQVHDAPDSLAGLAADAPLHVLLAGAESEGDRRLVIREAPGFGIVGRKVTVKVLVEDLGGKGEPAIQGGTVALRVRRDGGPAETLRLQVGRETEIEFEIAHRGRNMLEIEAAPGPAELTLANNRAAVELMGVRERLRVLLISGEPHAGERAWRHLLKSDPSVDLVHFTILRPPEKQDGTPIRELSLIAFPTRELFEIKIDDFDLVIFDRYRRRGVLPRLYLDNVADYVDNGGALLQAVGPTFASPLSLFRTPVGRVMPGEPTSRVFEAGYRPRVTETGHRHPVTAGLPGTTREEDEAPAWGRWFRQVETTARRGDVLMSGVEERPLLILDRVGEGRVAQLNSDHIWLWARGFEGGGPQAELMRRVAHWLMKEPDLEEQALRAEIVGNRLEVERRFLGTLEDGEATVTLPDGTTQTVELEQTEAGRARAGIPVDQPGLYRVDLGMARALATAGAVSPLELQDVRATAEVLAPLVAKSGGALHRMSAGSVPPVRKVALDRETSGGSGDRQWMGLVANRDYIATGLDRVGLLPAALSLLLALGGMVLAWWREGR